MISKLHTIVTPLELTKKPADSHVRLVEQILKDIQVEDGAKEEDKLMELRNKLASVEKLGTDHSIYKLLSDRVDALLIENIPENPSEDLEEAVGKVTNLGAAISKAAVDGKHRGFDIPQLKLTMPSGMTGLQSFFNVFVHDFLALIIHNRAVHQPLYTEIYNAYILGGRLLESLHRRPTFESEKSNRDQILFKNPSPESVIIGDQMDCSGKEKINKNFEIPRPPTFEDVKFANKSRKDKP